MKSDPSPQNSFQAKSRSAYKVKVSKYNFKLNKFKITEAKTTSFHGQQCLKKLQS